MKSTRRRACQWAGLLAVTLLAGACGAQEDVFERGPTPQVRPEPAQSYLSLGKSLLATNEPALAMRAFTASMSTEGVTPEAMTGAGIAARRQGLLTAARRYLEEARSLAPRSPAVHNNLGVVLLELKEYHAARAAFRTAVELSAEENDAALENLARAEAAISRQAPPTDEAGTPRVVRLGTDRFQIVEAGVPETEAE